MRVRQAGTAAECGACGGPIPPRKLLVSDGGRSWRCLSCALEALLRERGGLPAVPEPAPLHKMGAAKETTK
jgi:hypothetical protein